MTTIKKASLDEIKKMKERGELQQKAASPGELDLGPEFWAEAEIVEPQPKKSVHLRVDTDVLEFFKAQGKGHLTRMNAVLRAYVQSQRHPE